MSTQNELTDLVLLNLQGFSLDQDQITYLTNPITATDLTFAVGDTTETSRGLVEIDDELIWVQSLDQSSATVTTAPQGRGWMGTTAVNHAAGAVVRNNPKWPRAVIKRAMNDIIKSTYPDLFAVKSTTFTFQAAMFNYGLPSDVADILDVTWDLIGPTKRWPRIQRWRYVSTANTGAFASGKSIEILDSIVPGRTVQVTYTTQPTGLTAGGDEFSVTGLPSTAEDVVMYGACHRLSGYLDIPRLQIQNVEGNQRSQLVPAGAAASAAKYFYALYQERLAQEREILLSRYPRITHLSRI
jgi:hypothetical protein